MATASCAKMGTASDHPQRTRIVFGAGVIERIGEVTRSVFSTRPLLVTDPGIVAAGHARRVRDLLDQAGLIVTVFDRAHENPTTEDVDACLNAARRGKVDAIIGLGGGSALDTAKGCNFLLTNGGRIRDYWGIGKAIQPMLPFIAAPTTAGTGSEMQSFALISDAKTHQKMACGDPKAAARVAILDPELTLTQPDRVTRCTGIDALAHAVETAVTTRRNSLSFLYSGEAFRLITKNLPKVLRSPADMNARAAMMLAAAYGGIAIENSMLGAAHSAANPLTAHQGITHGHAVGIMLLHVMRFNTDMPAQQDRSLPPDRPHPWTVDHALSGYESLARSAGLTEFGQDAQGAVGRVLASIEQVLDQVQLPRWLCHCGVDRSSIPGLATEAANQWTARYNPRPLTAADFARLYEAAFEPS